MRLEYGVSCHGKSASDRIGKLKIHTSESGFLRRKFDKKQLMNYIPHASPESCRMVQENNISKIRRRLSAAGPGGRMNWNYARLSECGVWNGPGIAQTISGCSDMANKIEK